jgi:hypothetical protein
MGPNIQSHRWKRRDCMPCSVLLYISHFRLLGDMGVFSAPYWCFIDVKCHTYWTVTYSESLLPVLCAHTWWKHKNCWWLCSYKAWTHSMWVGTFSSADRWCTGMPCVAQASSEKVFSDFWSSLKSSFDLTPVLGVVPKCDSISTFWTPHTHNGTLGAPLLHS